MSDVFKRDLDRRVMQEAMRYSQSSYIFPIKEKLSSTFFSLRVDSSHVHKLYDFC